jgi:galactokinase
MASTTADRGRIEDLRAAFEVEYGPGGSKVGGLPGNRAADSGSGGVGWRARHSAASPVEIVRAPVAVTLMGDYTGYNDGLVLPAAIGLETWMAFRRRLDGRVRVASRGSRSAASFRIEALVPAQSGEIAGGEVDPDAWSDYVAATAWSLRESALPMLGFDGLVDTTVPPGDGFSQYAAVELASAVALLGHGFATAAALAAMAQRGEREYLGLDCGIVDQLVSAAGREGRALMIDCRSLDIRYVPLPFGLRVVVCSTGSTAENGPQILEARRIECARAVALLAERMPGLSSLRDLDGSSLRRHRGRLPDNLARRAEHVVSENARVLATAAALEACDLDKLSRLFAVSHASMRDRYEVGSAAIEAMVDVATAIPGVVATRMTGRGGGTVNLVLSDAVPALEAAVSREYGRRTGLVGRVYAVDVVNGAGSIGHSAE